MLVFAETKYSDLLDELNKTKFWIFQIEVSRNTDSKHINLVIIYLRNIPLYDVILSIYIYAF